MGSTLLVLHKGGNTINSSYGVIILSYRMKKKCIKESRGIGRKPLLVVLVEN